MRLAPFTLPVAGLLVVVAGVLVFGDLSGQLVYYLTPTEAVEQHDAGDDRRFRLAGTVEPGSVSAEGADAVAFVVTDGRTSVDVQHVGAPPQLFQEGIEVVVEGSWDRATFRSDTMLVKHDEEYYPPDEGPQEAAS